MRRHALTKVLPYTPDQLFELVGAVELYPEFVPWITEMRVRNLRAEGDDATLLDAEAAVGFSFLKERFATRVRRDAHSREIVATLLWGPFKRLVNRWSFHPHALGCEVVFDIDFAFKSRLLDALLSANFDRAVERLMVCFEARAAALYRSEGADPEGRPGPTG